MKTMRPLLQSSWRGRANGRDGASAFLTGIALLSFVALMLELSAPIAVVLLGALLLVGSIRPRSVLALVPVAIPFAPVHVRLGTGQFSALEIAVVISVLATTVHELPGILQRRWWQRLHSWSTTVLLRASFAPFALALLAVGTASLFVVADPEHLRESLREWRWVILEPVGWYIAAIWSWESHDRRRALALWVGASALASLVCLGQWLAGGGVSVEGVRRLSGLYPHPNAAALTLERAAAAALLLALSTRDRDRWFWTIAGACIASATALTFSRGAWAALAISGILAAFLSGRRRLGVGVAGSALLAFLAAFLLFPERFRTDLTSGSEGLRLAIWRSTLTMLGDRPLTGVGLDQYLYQYLPRYVEPSAWPERFTSHPHNVFLDAWVRLGMGGLLLVCIAVWTVVRSLRRQTSPLTAAVGLGLFTGLLHGLVDRAYFTPELAFSFWLAAVILDLPRTAPSAANDGGRDQCAFW